MLPSRIRRRADAASGPSPLAGAAAPRTRRAIPIVLIATAVLLSLHACNQLAPAGGQGEPAQPAAPAPPVPQDDHGDTPATATTIRPGSPLSGRFETDRDVDYFKVEVRSAQILYVSTDPGAPDHRPTIVNVGRDTVSANRNQDDQVQVAATPGTYYVKVEPAPPAASATPTDKDRYQLAVWLLDRERATFDIQLRYLGTAPTRAQRDAIERAASFWEGALRENANTVQVPMRSSAGGCTDTPSLFGTLVDDLLINIQLMSMDGVGGQLAQAGYCSYRTRSGLPVIGIVIFDTADLSGAESNGSLVDLTIHEMGHALGFGPQLWDVRGYFRNPTFPERGGKPISPRPDTHFSGPRARREFDTIGGASYGGAKVPVENQGAEGSADAHWRLSVFCNELMTAVYDPASSSAPVSSVTLASLEDLGYAVDYAAADASYRVPSSCPTRLSVRLAEAALPGTVAFGDDLYPVPPRPLEMSDELLEALNSR